MIRLLTVLTILAFTALTGMAAEPDAAPSGWDRYERGTLAGVMKELKGIVEEHDSGVSAGFGDHPTRARVQYMGKTRAMSDRRRGALHLTGRTNGLSDDVLGIFNTEVLFREGQTDFWIPVQDATLPYYAEELTPGQTVDLFVIIFGLDHLSKGKADHLFLANDFQAVQEKTGN